MLQLHTFRTFVKPVDRPATTRCEILARRLHLGVNDDKEIETARFDVEWSDVYESVIAAAGRSKEQVQVGIEFSDGVRVLLTGYVDVLMPSVFAGETMLDSFKVYATNSPPAPYSQGQDGSPERDSGLN